MTTATITEIIPPATPAQINYLSDLVKNRDPEAVEVIIVKSLLNAGTMNKKYASTCIDTLLKLPKVPAAAPAPAVKYAPVAAPLAAQEIKIGLYDTTPGLPENEINSGRYVLVYKNAKGYMKAKRMYKSWNTKSGWSWKGIGLYGIKGWVASGKAVPVDAESASKLGKQYGFCMYCGHLLTTDESLTAGYGPVCADTYGLSWGK